MTALKENSQEKPMLSKKPLRAKIYEEPKYIKKDKNGNLGYKPIEKKENGIKTIFIGTRTMRDTKTGEIVELDYVEKKVAHTLKGGWRRVYLENFFELLTGLYSSGRKLDVIEFILNNLDSENKFIYSQKEIMKKIKVSKQTVVDTYKYLIENDFMTKKSNVFVVNPKFVCAFGSDNKNRNIMINYSTKEPSLPGLENLKNEPIHE